MFQFRIVNMALIGAEKCLKTPCLPPDPGCGDEIPGVWAGPIWVGNAG
jgi:hypothetical protein